MHVQGMSNRPHRSPPRNAGHPRAKGTGYLHVIPTSDQQIPSAGKIFFRNPLILDRLGFCTSQPEIVGPCKKCDKEDPSR